MKPTLVLIHKNKSRIAFLVILAGIVLLVLAGLLYRVAPAAASNDIAVPSATPAPTHQAPPTSSAQPTQPPSPSGRDPEGGSSGMMSTPDQFARPTLPANPSPADLGGQVYYYVCMACHGDRGQGLTQEYVQEWGLGPKACWESKCHASNHPPEGFELPKVIPPVVGPIMHARFATALELHDFIKTKMPWQAPGKQTDEEYWQLTAYLLQINGVDPGLEPLNAQSAALIRLRPEEPLRPGKQPSATQTATPVPASGRQGLGSQGTLWLGGAATIGLLLLLVVVWPRHATRHEPPDRPQQ